MEEEACWKNEVKKGRKGREDAGIDGFVMLGFSTALDLHGMGGAGSEVWGCEDGGGSTE